MSRHTERSEVSSCLV